MERVKKYYNEIDIIKGIAIILVMLGHSELVDNLPPVVHRFNQYYSMALFMLASGFLFSSGGSWSVFLGKKVKRLVVPYISFGILTILMKYCKYGVDLNLKDEFYLFLTGQYYWFLYVLFIFMIVAKLLYDKKRLLITIAVISFIYSVLIIFIKFDISLLTHRLLHFPLFFLLGIFLRSKYNAFLDYYNRNLVLLLIVTTILFVVFVVFNNYGYIPLLCEFVGIAFWWFYSLFLLSKFGEKKLSALAHFGKYSLQYYLNHLRVATGVLSIVLLLGLANPMINYTLIFLIVVSVSFLMLIIEKRVRVLRFLSGII